MSAFLTSPPALLIVGEEGSKTLIFQLLGEGSREGEVCRIHVNLSKNLSYKTLHKPL